MIDDGVATLIRSQLREIAVPERAAAQQAYMKSAMPFLGARVPEVRRVARAAAVAVRDGDELRAIARDLWDHATHREERYAAEAVLALGPARGDPRQLPVIEHLVRTGRWWDFTDELSGRLREVLEAHPVETAPIVRAWATDDDVWIRRIAILSQLTRRSGFDADLLRDAIRPNLADGEFFIRKAIGWALRDRARTDPEWVRRFAADHDLSPLSRREALKHL